MLDYFHNSNATQQTHYCLHSSCIHCIPQHSYGCESDTHCVVGMFPPMLCVAYCMFAAQEMAAGWTANSGSRWPKVTAAFRRMAKSLEGAFGDVP